MSAELQQSPVPIRALRSARIAVLALLLGGEMLVFSMCFHTGQWFRSLSHHMIAICALTPLVFAATRQQGVERSPPSRFTWKSLAVHLLSFAALLLVSGPLLQGDHSSPGFGELARYCLWLAFGAVVLGTWFVAAMGVRFDAPTISRGSSIVAPAVCLAVGVTWLTESFSRHLWQPLAIWTTSLVALSLRLFTRNLVYEPDTNVVGTQAFSVEIGRQCSGHEGIALVLIFLAVFCWLWRDRLKFPIALLLFPAGVVASWLANVARITLLIGIGHAGYPKLALGGFHSQAGWLAFNAIALGLILVAHRVFATARHESAPVAKSEPLFDTRAMAYLLPLMVLVATGMLAEAVFDDSASLLYPVRMAAVLATLWCFRGVYRSLEWSWSWTAAGVGAAVYLIWILLEPRAVFPETVAPPSAIWIAIRAIGSIAIVPLAEELAFRGYLQRRVTAPDFESVPSTRFSLAGWLISSVAFGFLHRRWFAGSVAGALFGLVMYRRGRLSDAVLAHAVANALIAIQVLSTGQASLWS